MKKIFTMLTVAMIGLTGCGGSDTTTDTANDSATTTEENTEENTEEVIDETIEEVEEIEEVIEEETLSPEEELAIAMEAENQVAMGLYSGILDTYKHLILNNESPEFEYERTVNDYNYMLMYANGDLEYMYYEFYDIDKNGVDELLLMDGDGNTILDLYTVINGELILVADSAERWSHQLNDDNTIRYSGSGGADESYEAVYVLVNGELQVFDNHDYYLSSSDAYLGEGQTWISKPYEWDSPIQKMALRQPNSTPLSQWNGL